MKRAAWCFFLTCAAALAQNPSDNAAAAALKKRMMGMDLLNLKTPKPIMLAGPVTVAPTVCSIPLLNVVPPGTRDKMPVIKPHDRALRGDIVQVPAPPCPEGLFINRK
jgi:hypothetical protein